jgi:uncharacterized protein YjbJ (UPF0337 family)
LAFGAASRLDSEPAPPGLCGLGQERAHVLSLDPDWNVCGRKPPEGQNVLATHNTPCAGGKEHAAVRRVDPHQSHRRQLIMDKDRVEGSAEQAKGKIKEVAGKAMGDSKLEAEGKGDQVKGKVQNTIGGIKDTLKGN